jgi:hypothetical protein
MLRYRSALAALLCAVLLATHAAANNAWFSLNLEFNQPGNFNSGGTWTVVAKADERGFSAIVMDFLAPTLNFNPATGFLTPPEFEIEDSSVTGLRLEILQADLPFGSPVYDVGVPGGTYPSSYVDDPLLTVLGSNPDLGSFTDGIALATGSFDPGDIPAWETNPNEQTTANLYSGNGFDVVPGFPNVFLTVRYINSVPEPMSIVLLGSGMAVLASLRRR